VSASPLAARTATLLASAFLGFDGALLLWLGWWTGRAWLVVSGLVLFVSSGLVIVFWRQHLRRLDQIAEARRELREEARSLRDLLGG
jgi:hypothetical protein